MIGHWNCIRFIIAYAKMDLLTIEHSSIEFNKKLALCTVSCPLKLFLFWVKIDKNSAVESNCMLSVCSFSVYVHFTGRSTDIFIMAQQITDTWTKVARKKWPILILYLYIMYMVSLISIKLFHLWPSYDFSIHQQFIQWLFFLYFFIFSGLNWQIFRRRCVQNPKKIELFIFSIEKKKIAHSDERIFV